MSISGMAQGAEALGLALPDHVQHFPVSFQRVFCQYWRPAVEQLQLRHLQWLDPGVHIDHQNWPEIRAEFLAVRAYVEQEPSCGEVRSYMLQRIDEVIANVETGFSISTLLTFHIG